MIWFIISFIIVLLAFAYLCDKSNLKLKKRVQKDMFINLGVSLIIFILVEYFLYYIVCKYYLTGYFIVKPKLFLTCLILFRFINILALLEVFSNTFKQNAGHKHYLAAFMSALPTFVVMLLGLILQNKLHLNSRLYNNMYLLIFIIYFIIVLFSDNIKNFKYLDKYQKAKEEKKLEEEHVATKLESKKEDYNYTEDDEFLDNLDDYYY